MKIRTTLYLTILSAFLLLTCNSEKLLFEKEDWWFGHWQNTDDPTFFFSIGQKPIGSNEIVTTQFFIATQDSIYANFYVEDLIDFNHRRKWKLIETSENQFIKIKELETNQLEISGPVELEEDLDTKTVVYDILPSTISPPIHDSILFIP